MKRRLPSWFWLLVSVASFSASALGWSLERPAQARQLQRLSAEAVAPIESDEPTPPALPVVGAAPTPVETAAPPPAPPQATFAAVLPGDAGGAAKVLRCVVRGRVTYVDVATACADGSAGKVTVLPR
jgi:hypothetical protein